MTNTIIIRLPVILTFHNLTLIFTLIFLRIFPWYEFELLIKIHNSHWKMFIIPLLRNGSKTHWYFRIFLKLSKFRQFDDFLIFDTFTASRRCFATLRKEGKNQRDETSNNTSHLHFANSSSRGNVTFDLVPRAAAIT